MANIIRILRSATAGVVPTAKTEGEPWWNEADLSFGVVDAAAVAQELIAIRFFSALATYQVGDHVVNVDTLYKCSTAVAVPGPFDVTDWEEIGAAGAPPAETDPLALHLTGGVMTGPIELPAADPTLAVEAAHKGYVDGEIATLETDLTAAAAAAGLLYLPLTAGATKPLTGPLVLDGNLPTAPEHATDKQYVDTQDAGLQAQISVLASNLIYSGSIAVQTDTGTYTPESGLTDGALPPALGNANKYIIVTDGGAADDTGNIPTGDYAPADWLVSDGAAWNWLPIGASAATAVTAPLVAMAPQVDASLGANVQTSIQGLFDIKLDDNSIIDCGTFP